MKIQLVWPSAEMSIFDVGVGIREALLAAGHDVIDYRQYRRFKMVQAGFEAYRPEGDERPANPSMLCGYASEGIPQMALLHRPDWIFVVCGMGIHPDSLLAARRAGFKVAIWFTEAPYNSDEEAELYLARFCDLAFVNERTSVSWFQKVLDHWTGGTATYLPHAYRPSVHRPRTDDEEPIDDEERCDVLLIGTGFAERVHLLEGIDWTGIKLRVLGFWPGIVEPSFLAPMRGASIIPNAETARLYCGAKIVLNPHRYADGAESANPRTYEAAACGAFQLSDYRAETEEVFGDSVPTYEPGCPWQLSALVRRYLNQDDERARLASLARDRAAPHTFDNRAEAIVAAMEQYTVAHGGNSSHSAPARAMLRVVGA